CKLQALSIAGCRKKGLPPAHHPVGFRKEAVTAQVHSITAVVDGLGNATDLRIGFQDDRPHVCASQQLVCRGQARGSAADNDSNPRHSASLAGANNNCLRRTKFVVKVPQAARSLAGSKSSPSWPMLRLSIAMLTTTPTTPRAMKEPNSKERL